MQELAVYLAARHAGTLIRKDNGNLQFRYDPAFEGPVLSQALPALLRAAEQRQHCQRQDLQVQAERPVGDVVVVPLDAFGQRGLAT